MNKRIATLVACGSLLSSLVLTPSGTAFANSYQQSPKRIYLNNSLVYNPDGFSAIDPESGQITTYFPFYTLCIY